MNELIWIKVDGFWQLYVNDKITIRIVNGCPDAYSIWIAIKDINFRGGFYNNIEDAKTKGLEVAQAICEKEKLVWKKNNDKWLLKVNSKITIELANYCGYWSIWLNKNDKVKISALHGLYDDIVDAKAEGLKVAQKILEEEK